MDLMLKGKTAIVGGASKGLGRACAQALAEEGANLAICSRSKPDIEKAAQEIRAATGVNVLAFAGDLDRYETICDLVAAAAEKFGRIDVLVSNSGGPLAHETRPSDVWSGAIEAMPISIPARYIIRQWLASWIATSS